MDEVIIGRIRKKLKKVEERLVVIRHATEAELARPFFERRKHVGRFLSFERRSYEMLQTELKKLLDEQK